jgi:2-oxoglutarate ferredoxin oxidoreductase subunit gamma
MKNTNRIILLGLGGQGILFAGKVLAYAAFNSGYKSTFMPTYGPEVHNGPVKAEVTISETEIHNPFIEKADNILLFHKFRAKEGIELISKNGSVFSKDFSVPEADFKSFNISTEAVSSNIINARVTNMVMLGAFISYTDLFDDKAVGEALKQLLSNKQFNLVSLNFKAFKTGKDLLKVTI